MTKKEKTKDTKTYSVDKATYELFDQVCKKNSINKSAFIENSIKDYLKENLGYDNEELYCSRENNEYIVSIINKDDTYFKLSDGTTIPQILFYQKFLKI